jgi:predicted Fe-Mo cluster-binding NifX family protein
MRIAVPKFRDSIAPSFEAAGHFLITEIQDRRRMSSEIVESEGCEGFGQVRVLREQRVNTLLCNGIKLFYRDMLRASGLTVIPNVSLTITEALELFLAGQLPTYGEEAENCDFCPSIPLDDLICWTKDLFATHGFEVRYGSDAGPFPVDLIAEITCPLCHKPVRVAVCCGAHAYRSEQELREFHRVSAAGFHASVYVHPATPSVTRCCQEYGIELIDPNDDISDTDPAPAGRIPLLQRIIPGHEKASQSAPHNKTETSRSGNQSLAGGPSEKT